ncbi:hypothetical protein BLGI_4036 [Brevibacillus laterosporus GI-9]|nr:hypothetical protein BLGI_4036 [Brevibacillus laterosporus GI-9]
MKHQNSNSFKKKTKSLSFTGQAFFCRKKEFDPSLFAFVLIG